MPGVYTINIDTEPQQPTSFQTKPKVLYSHSMDGASIEGGREGNRGGSPLIDLTSRSPSPPSPPLHPPTSSITLKRPAPQLSVYAQPCQTHVHTTVATIHSHSPPPKNPALQHTQSVVVTTLTRDDRSQCNSTGEPTTSSSPSLPPSSSRIVRLKSSMPHVTTDDGVVGKVRGISRQASVSPTPSESEITTHPTSGTSQSHTVTVSPSPPTNLPPVKDIAATGTSSNPPALLEYVNTHTNGSIPDSHPHMKSNPLQFSGHKATSSSHHTNAVTTVTTETLQMSTSSRKVGVVSPEPSTTNDFPQLRLKGSTGGEEEEEEEDEEMAMEDVDQFCDGERKQVMGESTSEEDNEADTDSVMELRIEDSINMEPDQGGRNAVMKERVSEDSLMKDGMNDDMTNKRTAVEGLMEMEGHREEDVMIAESESHSNSIGMSPSSLLEVRGGHSVGSESRLKLQTDEEEEGEEHLSRSLISPRRVRGHNERYEERTREELIKFPRTVMMHGNNSAPSLLVLKGSVATVSPSLPLDNGRGLDESRGGGERERRDGVVPPTDHNGDIFPSYRVRKVAKVKQFFSTLQHFGNKQSSEVADQVQELIAALVNGTATIEEFHQEIQTVTNHPLRQFIIPFLKENLDLFRDALRDSHQALSTYISHAPSSSTPSSQQQATIAVTPLMIDDDLPVLPPTSKPLHTPTRHTPSSSSSPSSSHPLTVEPPGHISDHHTNSTAPIHQRSVHSQTVSVHPVATTTMDDFDSAPHNSPATRKRHRHTSTDRVPVVTSIDVHTETQSNVKRARPDLSYPSVSMDTTVIPPRRSHVPIPGYSSNVPGLTSHSLVYSPGNHGDYPHTTPSTPQVVHYSIPPPSSSSRATSLVGTITNTNTGSSRKQLLAEDWTHVDMMLNSVCLMAQKARDAIATLKDRVLQSSSDMEKREQEQQRLAEETEKARRHWQEEKIHIQRESARKIKEAVAQVKVEMEQKIAQAQSLAVQETLKEANTQTNSKESCWNCGRRATETCSGCNKARYCGTFCQHKDWGNHMHQCASGLMGMADDRSTAPANSGGATRVILQSGDTCMTSSITQEEPPDVKPRISPEQLMNLPQISVHYPMT